MRIPLVLSTLALVLPRVFTSPAPASSDTASDDSAAAPAVVESDDVRILNYALSWEYLATAFYEKSLSLYSNDDFTGEGHPDWVYKRYEEIYQHRQQYISFLESTITATGNPYITPCTYDFTKYTATIGDFLNLSEWFEIAGTSMYQGALQYISDNGYKSIVGSILGVQARHAAWIHSAVQKKNPWNTPFETGFAFNQIWSIGFPFYASCPSTGPGMDVLPPGLRDYPTFHIGSPTLYPGRMTDFDLSAAYTSDPSSLPSPTDDTKLFVLFSIGTGPYIELLHPYEDSDESHKYWAMIPNDLASKGAVYVSIVKASAAEASQPGFQLGDNNMVAGPKIWMFDYDSNWMPSAGYELFNP
ncbi:hypothetical protein CC1G_13239 [Coprinopsis cinerea okayama7|uniref:Rds1 n=1 Tax=Coprinopsis cinerea (strain Okayama-7 / 130 / ATCC MYA-4618 / FGSC 9003) TaxID=240176 RepID=A8PI32_COPC7|nr:hypothetical protein CC1G_13239 [Coprinopsis cinerea okayama7\|eukprot:XP_001841507.1 hypothetical protein CC1G_13239 [Coprinopsis cinerea okayama7\